MNPGLFCRFYFCGFVGSEAGLFGDFRFGGYPELGFLGGFRFGDRAEPSFFRSLGDCDFGCFCFSFRRGFSGGDALRHLQRFCFRRSPKSFFFRDSGFGSGLEFGFL